MSLAHGRPYLAIPGPSVMPDAVLQAMHRASPNIYEGELPTMVDGLIPDLKRVARTDGHVAIYIANGHGTWEAALSNIVMPGESVLVCATGRFGHGWAEMARAMGIEVDLLEFGKQAPVDPEALKARLLEDKGQKIKAVLTVHVDTSSSIRSDIAECRRALEEAGHPALLAVDCIASLGCDRFEMDLWGADLMITASQKGLMVPPGLGFVFFNDRAAAVRAKMPRVSRYWDWSERAAPEMFYQYFGGTAPTHHLYGLRAALDLIHAEGMEAVWARHAVLARAIWAAAETWGEDGPLRLNVADPAHRSHAVTALRLGAPHGARLRAWTAEQAGVTLGIGLGMSEEGDPKGEGFFRFGHMGHVNAHMILGLLGTVEAGLAALAVPHGAGGVSAAARVIAEG
ncbi:alanine-glyoxylate transaminase / serine-glyoxylate transaminase / serine-pyruvate transaminase [Roseivivax halotolerans]|uniref:Alanine-glyoxylate transaminase / serine-glyoxylate transaminase / serine-pyruvate transaminase n=1 Tax=Roseivivax halotolerans TaxID=93684 RepID=A0A1I6A226_9RHOB|nr:MULTISPECIES: aminotransferase class V-fold PLP-dependent enzyme [Roseivivax]QFT62774.1 Soluble hydrogenase 42 kDa subunit [Roseivivax sp. THAF30]SFQ62587.1 alanine-glyoxylate transaminase / serine-glyoxylate transaminase / serine-pyruvate transaminase [Roseivivax halotolerans]